MDSLQLDTKFRKHQAKNAVHDTATHSIVNVRTRRIRKRLLRCEWTVSSGNGARKPIAQRKSAINYDQDCIRQGQSIALAMCSEMHSDTLGRVHKDLKKSSKLPATALHSPKLKMLASKLNITLTLLAAVELEVPSGCTSMLPHRRDC
eukprot:6204128-Pleurochrysis_carterae.AAC.1